MASYEQVVVRFKAPYMAFNPGEVAGFTPKQAARLIKSNVATKVEERTIEAATAPTAKSRGSSGVDPSNADNAKAETKEEKPRRRRRGSSSSSEASEE